MIMIFEWFIDMVSFLIANPLVSTDKKNPTPRRMADRQVVRVAN